MLVSRHPKEPEPGTSLLVVKNGTLVPRNPTPPPPPQISEEALKTAALEKTAQAIAVEITENGLNAEDFCGLLQRTYPDVWEHVKKAWLSKEAVDAHEEAKTAGTARLLRSIASLNRSGKPVPPRLTSQLADKTQSTATRQLGYFNQNLPDRKPPNWDATWGQSGRLMRHLDGRVDNVQAISRQLPEQRQIAQTLVQQPSSQTPQQQRELLQQILKSRGFLRSTGRDIGRSRGTVAPAQGPIPAPFDPLKRIEPTINSSNRIRVVDLNETQTPNLEILFPPSPHTPTVSQHATTQFFPPPR